MKNILIYIFALCAVTTSFAGQEHLYAYKFSETEYLLCRAADSISLEDFKTGMLRLVDEKKMYRGVTQYLDEIYDKFSEYSTKSEEKLKADKQELWSTFASKRGGRKCCCKELFEAEEDFKKKSEERTAALTQTFKNESFIVSLASPSNEILNVALNKNMERIIYAPSCTLPLNVLIKIKTIKCINFSKLTQICASVILVIIVLLNAFLKL